MPTVTSYTSDHIDALINTMIVGAAIVSGHLVLTTQGGVQIDVGSVSDLVWDVWVAGVPQGTWTNNGTPYATLGFRKSLDGKNLQLTGTIGGGFNGSVAFTLPVGFRPITTKSILSFDGPSGSLVFIVINTDGTVTLTGANRAQVSVNGMIALDR